MLELPSTTQVNRRLPKEVLYKRIKPNAATKEEFVQGIEALRVVNSIKQATVNVPAGATVQEILVVRLELKRPKVPLLAIEAIAKDNPHKLLFECAEGSACTYAVLRAGQVWVTPEGAQAVLGLKGATLDEVWDAFCSEIIFAGKLVANVDEALARKRCLEQLSREIAKLERKHAKERQPAKRNELFRQLRMLKAQKNSLSEEEYA